MVKEERRREEEIIETALAAAGAALAISAIKNLLIPLLLNQLPLLSFLLVIGSIVIVSMQLTNEKDSKSKRRESADFEESLSCDREKHGEKKEEEDIGDGDAEELNRRVEAFIMAFRHQLWVDSFSSQVNRSNASD